MPSEESLDNQGWLEKRWLWVLKLREVLDTKRNFLPIWTGKQGDRLFRVCPVYVLEVFKT